MILEQDFINLLLEAPDTQLDTSMFEIIKSWELNPSSLDILFLLDNLVCFSLASEFTIHLFKVLLDTAMEEEGITYVELVKLRTWDLLND